jgi:hypothetical protein
LILEPSPLRRKTPLVGNAGRPSRRGHARSHSKLAAHPPALVHGRRVLNAVAARAAPPAAIAPHPDDAPARLYAWFDTLGYPDLSRARFIRVATGSWEQTGDGPAEPIYRYGFLLADDEATFTALSLSSLQVRTLEKNSEDREIDRVGFEDGNLTAYIDTRLKPWINGGSPYGERKHIYNTATVGERGQFFLLARAAAHRGQYDQAAKLMEAVARLPRPSRSADPGPRSTRQLIADDLAFAETWQAIQDLGDKRLTRSHVLAKLERVATQFPEFAKHAEVAAAVTALRRLVREDEAHANRRDLAPLDRRPVREQIAEAIYRLRDLDNKYYAHGYYGGSPPSPPENVVHQVAAYGPDAIPQLLAAMDDDGFIRVQESFPGIDRLEWPPTIGEAAETAIGYAAGRRFELADEIRYKLSPGEQKAEKKRLIRAWYDDVRTRGLKTVLIDAMRSDADYATYQAARLAVLFPNEAADLIIDTARNTSFPRRRREFLGSLTKLPGDAVEPFLLEEVRSGPTLDCHVAAARILLNRQAEGWAPILIRHWNELPLGPTVARDNSDDYRSLLNFASFLVDSGDPDAVRAVGRSMRRLPIEFRGSVVRAAGSQLRQWKRGKLDTPLKPGYEGALYELLIAALDDDRERAHQLGWYSGEQRICDIAGQAFDEIDSSIYSFEIKDDEPARNRALKEIGDTVRRERGLPPRTTGAPRAAAIVTAD